ncbi:MAG: hypothetical protein AAGI38_23575 [Bacteroidota bacterium]
MKTYLQLSFIGLLAFFLIACDTDDDPYEVPTIDPNSVQVTDLEGNRFVVALFNDEGEDETPEFAGYTIEFQGSNELLITGNGKSISGTWELETPDSEVEIALNGFDEDPLEELAEDWLIKSWDGTMLKLIEDDDGQEERLHLRMDN